MLSVEPVLSYVRVNDALNKAFVSGRYRGRALYLTLDNQARSVAAQLSVDEGEVEEACSRAVGGFLDRRPKGRPKRPTRPSGLGA